MMSTNESTATATDPSSSRHAGDDALPALLCLAARDLWQPLQVTKGTYDWLASRPATPAVETIQVQRGESAIEDLTIRLDGLVRALRLHEFAQTMEISPVPLSGLFSMLGNEIGGIAYGKDITLKLRGSDHKVRSNPVLLASIVRALIANAVRYTRRGGRILVGCRKFGEQARIDVYDMAAARPCERMPNVLDAFSSADRTPKGDARLEMLLARRAVGLLGHRMDARLVSGRGYRVSIHATLA